MSAYIQQLQNLKPGEVSAAGGKAVNLAKLMAAGLAVPEGFCVTTDAYRNYLGHIVTDLAAVSATSIQQRILTGELPTVMQDELAAAYWQLVGAQGGAQPVAVRSSATAEDLAGASFAGQYDSFLNVRGGDVLLNAVKRCWASLWTERAVAYRAQHKVETMGAAMAVIVQAMVPAEVSGVAFTVNPVSGDSGEMLVNAARGLGDAVVSGRIAPDEFTIDKATRTVKRARIVNQTASTAPWPRRQKGCLSTAQLNELARIALTIEQLFGAAQDIEWAYSGGMFHILQARPVTAMPQRQKYDVSWGDPANQELARSRTVFWCNWNTRENMPYPLKPMAWSSFNDILVPEIMKVLYGIGPGSPLEHYCHFIDLVDGRAYWNMTLLAGHPFGGRTIMGLLDKLDIEADQAFKSLAAEGAFRPAQLPIRRWSLIGPFFRNAATFLSFPWLASPRWLDRRCDRFWRQADQYVTLELSGRSTLEIIGEARRYGYIIAKFSFPLLVVASKSLLGLWIIGRLVRRWPDLRIDTLLAGIKGNKTTETALELFKLSQAPQPVRDIFCASDITGIAQVRAIDRKLSSTPEGKIFLQGMGHFMTSYGHRGMKDLDVGYPSWKEDPTYVYQMIKSYLTLGPEDPNPLAQFEKAAAKRVDLEREIERRLSGSVADRVVPIRRWLFRWAKKLVHDFFPWRENEKFYGIKVFPGSRRIIVEIGRRYAAAGLIGDPGDIFYLTVPEVERQERGRGLSAMGIKDLVQERKAKWEHQVNQPAPFIVRSDGVINRTNSVLFNERNELRGIAAASGAARGRARIIREPSQAGSFRAGEILVAPYTEPGWAPLFLLARALVMEVGGSICHGAIVAREYGIPAVVGVRGATELIRDGDEITVDGDRGVVVRHARAVHGSQCPQ